MAARAAAVDRAAVVAASGMAAAAREAAAVPEAAVGRAARRSSFPKIRHVWLVVLADQTYNDLYGTSSVAHYLNSTLVPQGTLLTDYYATAHGGLADEIAMLSGQGPTTQLQANCPDYQQVTPGKIVTKKKNKQVEGQGCVFPKIVSTLPGELSAKHLTWRAYVAGQGPDETPAVPVLRDNARGNADDDDNDHHAGHATGHRRDTARDLSPPPTRDR